MISQLGGGSPLAGALVPDPRKCVRVRVSVGVVWISEAYKPVADTLKEVLAIETSPWFRFVHPDAKSTMNTVKDFLEGLVDRRGVARAIALVIHRDFYRRMVRVSWGSSDGPR